MLYNKYTWLAEMFTNTSKKLSRYFISKELFKSCWRIFMEHKVMLLFPLLSCAMSLSFVAGVVLFYFIEVFHSSPSMINFLEFILYVLLLGVAIRFVIVLICAAKMVYLHAILRKEPISLATCWWRTLTKLWPIFLWFLALSTVGLICGIVGSIPYVGLGLEMTIFVFWYGISFVAMPVIVLHEDRFLERIKEASKRLKNNFIVRRRSGSICWVLFFIPSLVLMLVMFASLHFMLLDAHLWDPTVSLVVFVVSLSLLVVIGVIIGMLNAIMQLVVYLYLSSGMCPKYFDPDVLAQVLVKRKVSENE